VSETEKELPKVQRRVKSVPKRAKELVVGALVYELWGSTSPWVNGQKGKAVQRGVVHITTVTHERGKGLRGILNDFTCGLSREEADKAVQQTLINLRAYNHVDRMWVGERSDDEELPQFFTYSTHHHYKHVALKTVGEKTLWIRINMLVSLTSGGNFPIPPSRADWDDRADMPGDITRRFPMSELDGEVGYRYADGRMLVRGADPAVRLETRKRYSERFSAHSLSPTVRDTGLIILPSKQGAGVDFHQATNSLPVDDGVPSAFAAFTAAAQKAMGAEPEETPFDVLVEELRGYCCENPVLNGVQVGNENELLLSAISHPLTGCRGALVVINSKRMFYIDYRGSVHALMLRDAADKFTKRINRSALESVAMAADTNKNANPHQPPSGHPGCEKITKTYKNEDGDKFLVKDMLKFIAIVKAAQACAPEWAFQAKKIIDYADELLWTLRQEKEVMLNTPIEAGNLYEGVIADDEDNLAAVVIGECYYPVRCGSLVDSGNAEYITPSEIAEAFSSPREHEKRGRAVRFMPGKAAYLGS
jgi:hypothetical protein